MVPSPFTVATPLLGKMLTTPVVVSVSESESESLERTTMLTGISWLVETESFVATGGSLLSGFKVMVTALVIHKEKNNKLLLAHNSQANPFTPTFR